MAIKESALGVLSGLFLHRDATTAVGSRGGGRHRPGDGVGHRAARGARVHVRVHLQCAMHGLGGGYLRRRIRGSGRRS
ncbi:MAG: hypothetical protein ACLTMP_08410 [Eggerthella lenta]